MPHDEPFEHYERPVLPHERKADPGFRGGGMVSAGFEFAIVVTLFLLGGRWLDGHFGTEPLWTVLLSLIGVAIAMTLLIRQVLRVSKPRKDAE